MLYADYCINKLNNPNARIMILSENADLYYNNIKKNQLN
ncbi:hypothetical protein ABSA28_00440 [Candidatus Hepatincolaceae symbiont of Richtersius coronifer]